MINRPASRSLSAHSIVELLTARLAHAWSGGDRQDCGQRRVVASVTTTNEQMRAAEAVHDLG